ncbi:hypothetical protein CPC08DRAFT_710709 [Agrocybe pediades]|nr:hypothetical protein CPC08DRAFT_710709 [Agrocybe pediades]
MKEDEQRSHISVLSEDLLWRIFNLFTLQDHDFDLTRAAYDRRENYLIALRYLSQVCTMWRNLLLSSSSIWADSLDFQYLAQKEDMWRKEILRRTGEAPLSIIFRSHGWPLADFLWTLIEHNWQRLRRVCVQNLMGSNEIIPRLKLISKAPGLQILCLDMNHTDYFNRTSLGYGQVKLPQSLCVLDIHGFDINLSTSPCTHLRVLTLHCRLHPDLLIHLARMKLLEEFTYFEGYYYSEPRPVRDVPAVDLPNLRSLRLDGKVEAIAAMLTCINPPPNLENFDCGVREEALTAHELELLQHGFGTYFQHVLNLNRAETVSLLASWDTFKIDLNPRHDCEGRFLPSKKIPFSFDVCPITHGGFSRTSFNWQESGSPGAIAAIMGFFTSSEPNTFSSITTIDFTYGFEEYQNAEIAFCAPTVSSWFASFSAAHTLRTGCGNFGDLLRYELCGYILFPGMKNYIGVEGDFLTTPDAEEMVEFAHGRSRMGIPVETWDLTACTGGCVDAFLLLEDAEGLEVKLDSEVRTWISRLKVLRELPEWEVSEYDKISKYEGY